MEIYEYIAVTKVPVRGYTNDEYCVRRSGCPISEYEYRLYNVNTVQRFKEAAERQGIDITERA